MGERGANITDLLCGRESSGPRGERGEVERDEGGVMVAAWGGGDGARRVGGMGVGLGLIRPVEAVSVLCFLATPIRHSRDEEDKRNAPSSRKCSFGSRGAVGGGGKYGTWPSPPPVLVTFGTGTGITGGTGTAV